MKNRVTPEYITDLEQNEIFVFGSNLQGQHAGGAAKLALQSFGAIMGVGIGLKGQSYALPTLDFESASQQLPIPLLKGHVDIFINHAKNNPGKVYLVIEVGCGIAGFTPEQIAPLFIDAADIENIHLPQRFWNVLKQLET